MSSVIHTLLSAPGTATTAPSWAQQAWAEIGQWFTATPGWIYYTAAGLIIGAGVISSIRIAIGRHTTKRQVKSDKFLTFLAAAVATGVVATGMWKFFGDVLHIANPWARGALFAFFEIAMLASAFRSRRFRLDRAARRENNPNTLDARIDVDGIAVWVLATLSGLFAAADEPTTTGKAVRIVAPLLAAWMWERGLAGELMQFTRGGKRLNLRLTPERVLVWLGVAEPSGRQIGEVDRKRRIALFARTAYRYNLMLEQGVKGWRVSYTGWRLRRLTESANEHLKLATDQEALGEVRAQLALMYGVKDGTSRAAVADLRPLAPAERLAISDRPFTPPADPHPSQQDSQPTLTEITDSLARRLARHSQPAKATVRTRVLKTFAPERAGAYSVENPAANAPASPVEKPAAKPVASPLAKAAKPARAPISGLGDAGPESVRKLAAAFARKPGGTNAELAKLARVSIGSANRHLPKIRAAANGSGDATASQESAQPASQPTVPITRIENPKPTVHEGVNGNTPNLTGGTE